MDSVLTFARQVVEKLDLNAHAGVHPRIGVLDVVPFVPLGDATIDDALVLRDRAAQRLSGELEIPCFLYGPQALGGRTLPSIRSTAFGSLKPDLGPSEAHPSAGAVAVGARRPLLAWNIWLTGISPGEAKRLAALVRSEHVRALGLKVGPSVQVSCNLIDPTLTTPLDVLDAVRASLAEPRSFQRCELVGLAPRAVLDLIDEQEWELLDLSEAATIEHAVASLDRVF